MGQYPATDIWRLCKGQQLSFKMNQMTGTSKLCSRKMNGAQLYASSINDAASLFQCSSGTKRASQGYLLEKIYMRSHCGVAKQTCNLDCKQY